MTNKSTNNKGLEIQLYNVVKGLLQELAVDYDVFIIDHNEISWSYHDKRYMKVESINLDRFMGT